MKPPKMQQRHSNWL